MEKINKTCSVPLPRAAHGPHPSPSRLPPIGCEVNSSSSGPLPRAAQRPTAPRPVTDPRLLDPSFTKRKDPESKEEVERLKKMIEFYGRPELKDQYFEEHRVTVEEVERLFQMLVSYKYDPREIILNLRPSFLARILVIYPLPMWENLAREKVDFIDIFKRYDVSVLGKLYFENPFYQGSPRPDGGKLSPKKKGLTLSKSMANGFLKETGGNKTQAARLAGCSRQTFYKALGQLPPKAK